MAKRKNTEPEAPKAPPTLAERAEKAARELTYLFDRMHRRLADARAGVAGFAAELSDAAANEAGDPSAKMGWSGDAFASAAAVRVYAAILAMHAQGGRVARDPRRDSG